MADVNISKYRASVVRSGSTPATPGFVVSEGQNPVEPAGSEQNHLPVTINATATGLAITTDQVLSGAGTVGQYIRGDGSLADFPASTGGGSSVSYYLNGSISQGTIGGVAYKELSKTPILGAGTQFTINADGYIASFLTDAGDPNLLEIAGGNWNFETYFSASSGGGSPTFYVELYKYDGSTFTLIASNSGSPELIAFGTNLTPYYSTLAVPTTALTLTDRLAIRYYVTHSGRTITLHTENNTLCQIITTFTTGLTALNGLTAQVQYFAVGTSGTDFNISSATQTHTFNLPTASASNRGALSSSDWTTFNNKQNALTNPVTGTGTTNYLPKFTGTSSIGNSIVQDAGIRVDIGGDIRLTPSSAVNIQAYTGSVYTNLFYNAASHNWQNSGGATKMFLNSNDNLLIGTTTDGGQRLQVTGTVALRASASGSSATQIPIFAADPSGTTRELVTRTPAQLLSDIGGQAALTNPVTGTGTTNYLAKFTGSTTVGNSQVFDNGTNVGIGTTSVSGTYEKLAVAGGISIKDNTNAKLEIGRYNTTGAQNSYIKLGANSNSLRFTNNTDIADIMELTNSGNLGLGVTPSAWGRGKGYEVGSNGNHIWGDSGTNGIVSFGANAYLSTSNLTTGWNYIYTGPSGRYQIVENNHQWLIAPSGTAGNAISFTQAMTLNASGNLLVGTTSDNGAKLNVNGTVFIGNLASGSNAILDFATNASGSPRSIIYRAATAFLDFTNTAGTAVFQLSNGGAATFSGSVTAGGDILTPTRVATDTINGYTGGSTPLTIQTGGAQEVRIGTNATTRLTISSTGAATFSSSVTASGSHGAGSFNAFIIRNTLNSAGSGKISWQGNASNETWAIAQNQTVGAGFLEFNYLGSNMLVINPSGNVGIGTSSPSAVLEVSGGNGNQLDLDNTGQQFTQMNFRNNGTQRSALWIDNTNSLFEHYVVSGYGQTFYTNATERMRITSSGNLLVGTTTDNGQRLQVSGGYITQSGGGVDTYLGYDGTGSLIGTTTNHYFRFITNNTERMRITAGGEVLIGNTDNGAYNLQCNGTGVWGAGAYVNGSDRNIKDNIATIEKGLEYIQKMNPVKFRYKPNYTRDHSMQTGFIAQELQEVFASEDYLSGLVQQGVHLSVAYQNLLPVLVKAIQEQQEIINELKQKIQ